MESGVVERGGDVRGESADDLLVVLAEGVVPLALEVENPDQSIAQDERHGQLGADLDLGVAEPHVAWVLADVGDPDGHPLGRGRSGDAMSERAPALLPDRLAEANRVAVLEEL